VFEYCKRGLIGICKNNTGSVPEFFSNPDEEDLIYVVFKYQIPTQDQINAAIEQLKAEKNISEAVLYSRKPDLVSIRVRLLQTHSCPLVGKAIV
jgi:hypothetical protein